MDRIIELEDSTCRLVRAGDLATVDIERSLRAVEDQSDMVPRICLSTFEGTVDLTSFTELDVQVVIGRISITETHVDLRAWSPCTEECLVISIKTIDIDTHLDSEALELYRSDTTSDCLVVLTPVGTEDRSTSRSDRLDRIDVGVSPLEDGS